MDSPLILVKFDNSSLKKYIRYSIKVLKILLLLIVIIYIGAYIYVSTHKQEIIARVTEQIGEKINGEVNIKNAGISFFKSFPRLAIHIQGLTVTDTGYQQHKHIFFEAKNLFFNLSLVNLVLQKPALNGMRIMDGSMFLFTDSTGFSNTYLMSSKKEPSGGPKKTAGNINIEYINLKQFHFTLLDEKREKYHDVNVNELNVDLDEQGDNLVMNNKADLFLKSVAFNVPRGTFLKNTIFTGKYILTYGKISQVLSFKNILIRLSGQPYQLTGSFDLGKKNPGFTLKVKTQDVVYDDVRKLLPDRISKSLSIISLDKRVDASAELYGPLRGGEPYIEARWQVKDATLKTIFMDFTHASFKGFYKNEVVAGMPRKDPNSVISVSDFTGDWHGLPVKSDKIQILDLRDPILTCDLRSAFPLSALNELVQTNSLKFTAGNANMVMNYKGPVERNNNTNSFLNGNINFNDGKILYAPRDVSLEKINGALTFSNSNVEIKNVRCEVLNNKIVMNGTADNVMTLISTEPNKVNIRYHIYSPSLNLASFTYLLKSRGTSQAKKTKSSNLNTLSTQLDELLEKSRIEVDLKADELKYKKLTGTNLNAAITILQDRYVLNNVNMNLAGGSMALKGQLVSVGANRHKASLQSGLKTVDVNKLLYAFDNFGQDGVTSANLRGILTANTDVSIDLDNEGKVLPATSNGTVDFSLKNGALVKFEPIKRMRNFLVKNRDFDNIEFAELKNKLEINKGEIKINRMEIQSTVLTLFVEGLYSQKGNSDMSIQIPLNNLKKRDEDYKPENIGTDKKGGRSIYLRGQPGDDGDIKFKLDLFKRYQKAHDE